MIVPTIGRVVLVNRSMSDQREPGLITYVFSDRLISVGGFDRRGFPFQAERVQLVQDDDKIKDERLYAEWPVVAAGKPQPTPYPLTDAAIGKPSPVEDTKAD